MHDPQRGKMLFKVKSMENIQMIACPSEIDSAATQSFELIINNLLESSALVSVLDFGETKLLDQGVSRVFAQFKQGLKSKAKSLASIKVQLRILLQMKKEGLEDVFSPMKNLDEVCKRFGVAMPSSPKIDVKFLNPFLSSIPETFQKNGNQLTLSPPRLNNQAIVVQRGVVGSVSIVSDRFRGSLRMTFSEDVAVKLVNALEGKEKQKLDDEVVVAIGKYMQIFFNLSKQKLKAAGFDDLIDAYPSLFEIEPGMQMKKNDMETSILMECAAATWGHFFIEIVIEG